MDTKTAMGQMDDNGDGSVTLSEFSAWWRRTYGTVGRPLKTDSGAGVLSPQTWQRPNRESRATWPSY